jgi:type II secretory pathway pseudopilin PulG
MWSLRIPGERRGSRGFVLIEALVAASVAAVLLAEVMRIFASTWSGISSVREDATAMLVARNVIEASASRNNVAAGTQEGVTGRYAWKVAVEQIGVAPQGGNAPALPGAAPNGGMATSNNGNNNNGTNANGGNNADASNAGNAANGPPWNLYRINVAVLAPGGRRTVIETYRLGRMSR